MGLFLMKCGKRVPENEINDLDLRLKKGRFKCNRLYQHYVQGLKFMLE